MNTYVTAALSAHDQELFSRSSPLCFGAGRLLSGLALALGMATTATDVAAQGFSRSDMSVGQNPRDVAIADFNWDGLDDLAIANQDSNNISVLWGFPGAVFAPAFSVPVGSGPVAILAADFTGDGIVDLATANTDSGTVSLARTREIGRLSGRRPSIV